MSIREVTKMGNPILRMPATQLSNQEILSKETISLLKDMYDTMVDCGGIGIAAPQVGVSKQVAIIKIPKDSSRYPQTTESSLFTIFNPKIEVLDETKQGFWEGCLSVPGLRGYVERPSKIKVIFQDEQANEKEIVLEGFLATVFQHELDHLFGLLYVDRIKDMSKLTFESEFEQFWATTD
ncbi:peptide deformylase [Halobacteriovorax sp. HLS]|uniref:peptide deformylase n=1 Tax=Halobacteriovorax sp. HLS TaxID=2234000 RepID=UPI000FDB31D6|nr:peptide deformylase [Halobacteriovorax sp. HLS]